LKIIDDLPTQISASLIASLIVYLIKYIFTPNGKLYRDLVISFSIGFFLGWIFTCTLPNNSNSNKDFKTIFFKQSICQKLLYPGKDTIIENRLSFFGQYDTLSKKNLYIHRLKARKIVLSTYYLSNKDLPVVKFITSFLEFEGNQKSIYSMDINKVDKLFDEYGVRLCEETIYTRENGFDIFIRYVLPKETIVLNENLSSRNNLQKAWISSLVYNQVLPRYQIDNKDIITLNYSDFLDSIYSNIQSYNNLYDYLPKNIYLWDFIDEALNEFSITGLPKNEYILTEKMKIFIREIVLNYIIRNIDRYSCKILCKGFTDRSQVIGGIRLTIDSLMLWSEKYCTTEREIELNKLDVNRMILKRKNDKLINNCELSYARGFMGIDYLKELIEKNIQSSIYNNRIFYSYTGMGEDVIYKDEVKKRRVDFKISIIKKLFKN
jgi:hypothetical protein